jgi:hypothetical protein
LQQPAFFCRLLLNEMRHRLTQLAATLPPLKQGD